MKHFNVMLNRTCDMFTWIDTKFPFLQCRFYMLALFIFGAASLRSVIAASLAIVEYTALERLIRPFELFLSRVEEREEEEEEEEVEE